jgi:CRP/FNR family transcriptional activator FtrB
MPDAHYADIRRLDLFAEMEDSNFTSLMRGSYVQNFPPRIELISEGETADFLHVVLSGSVDLYSSWNNRETSMATIVPVSTFILAATIRDAPYLMSARTLEKSRIALLPSQDVRAIFDIDAAFARAIVLELAQCYRSVVKNTKNLKLRTSLERLANYLVRQHKVTGALTIDLNMEKRRLASFLGMTPENLSRAFRGLEPYGVNVSGSRIEIQNLETLEGFARPSVLIDDLTS